MGSCEALSNRVTDHGRDMCRLVTFPLIVYFDEPGNAALDAAICAGFTKPMKEWNPGGPNSWK